jgi:hypothetical protein
MSKRQEIVILRQELARVNGMYEQAVTTCGLLQSQIVALASREPPAADIVREVMAGFKAVMNPDLPPADEPADLYSLAPGPLPGRVPDPAWEIPDILPDGLGEALEREGLEDDD